jgi:Mn2+/Fe2+ NRAMP family transporter
MAVMMVITTQREVMGNFTIGGGLRWLGWASTAAIGACVGGMAIGWFV